MVDNRTAGSDTGAGAGLREHRAFIILTVLALAAAGAVWFGFPHEKTIPNIGVLIVKVVPFVIATEAIAAMRLSQSLREKLSRLFIPLCFLVFFAFFVPQIFFAAANDKSFYYLVLTLTPFIILALTLSFRLGGGSSGGARRLGYAMILLQLSGIEDLAFLTINPHTDPAWTPIPQVWTWADHMTVFFGRPATKNEAFVFIAVHLVLAVLILTLPDRIWRKIGGWFRPGRSRNTEISGTKASGVNGDNGVDGGAKAEEPAVTAQG